MKKLLEYLERIAQALEIIANLSLKVYDRMRWTQMW